MGLRGYGAPLSLGDGGCLGGDKPQATDGGTEVQSARDQMTSNTVPWTNDSGTERLPLSSSSFGTQDLHSIGHRRSRYGSMDARGFMKRDTCGCWRVGMSMVMHDSVINW